MTPTSPSDELAIYGCDRDIKMPDFLTIHSFLSHT